MLKYNHLLGRKFIYGRQDCYAFVRDFYKDNFNIEMTNYARPMDWWDHGLNLYYDNFYVEGFRVVDDHPVAWRPGDVILMAIMSKVGNHAAVIVENGKIAHHMIGRLSAVDSYAGLYRNTTIGVFRHKDVDLRRQATPTDIREILPDAVRQKLSALEARRAE